MIIMEEWKNFNKKAKLDFDKLPVGDFKAIYNPYVFDRIHFKTYPRMQKIRLLTPILEPKSLRYCLDKRSSSRNFGGKMSFQEFSTLLQFGSGISKMRKKDFDSSRRYYPSAGARFPLELYAAVFNISGIEKGIYHYNVRDNSLELLLKGNFRKEIDKAKNQSWTRGCSAMIFVSAVFARTTLKYGERGYRYALLDCGHMAQNFYLTSAALNIGCCTIGGFWDDKLNELLDIDGENESVIYVIVLGKPKQ